MKHFILIILVVLMSSCRAAPLPPASASIPTDTPQPNIPNPASVFCEQKGYRLETRTAADGSQGGVCVFPDGSKCDEWAYFRGECAPGTIMPDPLAGIKLVATDFPTPFPIDPAGYQGFWTYTHPVYGFSIMLPEDWDVEETTTNDPLMNGHTLNLHPSYASGMQNIRMTFRHVGEDVPLWPTGVGQGEFIPQGTLEVAGQPAQRVLLVCPNGEVTAIWYHQGENEPNITRGNLEFGFIFSAGSHCEAGSQPEREDPTTGRDDHRLTQMKKLTD